METRKIIEYKVVLEFEGDYYDLDDCEDAGKDWMYSGLDDRSDLRYVDITCVSAIEEDL